MENNPAKEAEPAHEFEREILGEAAPAKDVSSEGGNPFLAQSSYHRKIIDTDALRVESDSGFGIARSPGAKRSEEEGKTSRPTDPAITPMENPFSLDDDDDDDVVDDNGDAKGREEGSPPDPKVALAAAVEKGEKFDEVTLKSPPRDPPPPVPPNEDQKIVRQPSMEEKIRANMSKVIGTVSISHKSMETDLEAEDKYWQDQQSAFVHLMGRIKLGQRTLVNFANMMKKQLRACKSAFKTLQMNGQWETFAEGEGMGMTQVCQTQHNLIKGISEYFDKCQEDEVFQKPIAESLEYAKEFNKFGKRIEKQSAAIVAKIRRQRDVTNRRWTAYKSAAEHRHNKFEKEKTLKTSEDPYLYFELYKRELAALHKLQASYNCTMGQIMAEYETKECQRARTMRNLMLGLVSIQKAFFEQASMLCVQSVQKLSSVDLEADLLRFRHSGGLLYNPHTADIEFMPTAMGLDFKNNKITGVRPGSQGHKHGVEVGWRILCINGEPAPATHQGIAEVLTKLKKTAKPIMIQFGKKDSLLIFDHPPPKRSTQHVQILTDAELATVGDLSRMSKTMGFTSWTKMYCIITCSGIMHMLKDRDCKSPYLSIQLHQSVVRLAPKIDPHAFEVLEDYSGLFSGGQKVHTFRTKTEHALVDWVLEIKKYLKEGKTDIKQTK